MKRISLTVLFMFMILSLMAQFPEQFNYQAIIRNQQGEVINNSEVRVKFSIIIGTAYGLVRYQEEFTPTTNEHGLVSLKIGTGNVLMGNFSELSWSRIPHFLLTEIDFSGEFNFVEISRTQFVSVPYAMHSKTAGNVFSGDYNDLSNKPNLDSIYQIREEGLSPGQFFAGGIVFFVDASGAHGLVVSLDDIDNSAKWGLEGTELDIYNSSWNGALNTSEIVSALNNSKVSNSAAHICSEYESNGYSDWYLPSPDEMRLLLDKLYVINKQLSLDKDKSSIGLSKSSYWTSEQKSSNLSYTVDFEKGIIDFENKSENLKVRAIRSF